MSNDFTDTSGDDRNRTERNGTAGTATTWPVEDLLFSQDSLRAAHDVWGDGPTAAVDAWTLHAGAMHGFGTALGYTVLDDPALVAHVNDVWETYRRSMGIGNATGLDALPMGFQNALDYERKYGGEDHPNLDIAHMAGYGWSDLDLEADLLSLELSAAPFESALLDTALARGSADSGPTGTPTETGTEESWETQFRGGGLLILARHRRGSHDRITIELRSQARTRSYRLTLHWKDGTQTTLDPANAGRDMPPARFDDVSSPDGDLPVRISVR